MFILREMSFKLVLCFEMEPGNSVNKILNNGSGFMVERKFVEDQKKKVTVEKIFFKEDCLVMN